MIAIKTLRQENFAELLNTYREHGVVVRLTRHWSRAWPPPWLVGHPAYNIHDYFVPIAADSLAKGVAVAKRLGVPPTIIVAGHVPRQGQSAYATWVDIHERIQLDERLGPKLENLSILDPIKHMSYESTDLELYQAAQGCIDSLVGGAFDLMLELAGQLKPGEWADCFTSSPLVPAFGRQISRDLDMNIENGGWVKDKLAPADSFVVLLRNAKPIDLFYMPAD